MRGAIRRSRVGEELGRLQRHSHAIRTQSARNQPFRHSHREPVVGEELGRLVREQHHEQHKAEQQTAGGTRVCKVHVPVGKGDGAVVSTGTQRQVISGNQRVLGDVRGHAPSRGSSEAINVVIRGNQRGHQRQSTYEATRPVARSSMTIILAPLFLRDASPIAVSYTHLTLPTIYSV